ncbi:hypothetical protein GOV13_04140 [Candidatus Pacearchaeota archaeon]|nr:hypothetical protein [Candidatus Pacearchaeota archaeon]
MIKEKVPLEKLIVLIKEKVRANITVRGMTSIRKGGLIQGAGYKVIRKYHFLSKDVREECYPDNDQPYNECLNDSVEAISFLVKPYGIKSTIVGNNSAVITIKPEE